MKNLVVVGGGTAGWITALYAQKMFPEENIVLVESKDLGILGAGEGSTPNIIFLLDFLNIPLSEVIKNTNATIKNAVRFTNWSSKKDYYYSGLFSDIFSNLGWDSADLNYLIGGYNFSETPSISNLINFINNKDLIDYDFVTQICEKNKIPFVRNHSYNNTNPISDFNRVSNISIHFDAKMLANFLSSIGTERGIKQVDGILTNIVADEYGNITNIEINNYENIKTDFVFDCTGFNRMIIGKFYKSEWVSSSKHLPIKKALPFFLENKDEKNIKPYSEAIAMDYGWMWRIPLQHRTGSGYAFDSDRISIDDAKIEVEKKLGQEVFPPKIFSFDPGYFKEIWINNCLAVGLSTGFMEPMEATSIWQAISELQIFFTQRQLIFDRNKKYIDMFNKRFEDDVKDVIDFIYFHYLTDKTDNDFWLNFEKNNLMPDGLKEKIFLLQEGVLVDYYCKNMFGSNNYYAVAMGNNILNKKNIKEIYDKNYLFELDSLNKEKNYMKKQVSETMIDHYEFLQYMKGSFNDK
jgi:tryptophan halogenase